MKTIWKFELETTNTQTIEMPKDAQILSIETQSETPVLYALVDTDNELEQRLFEVFGTGHKIMYDMGVTREYIGTYKMRNDRLVFHVFEYTGV